jgi:hypothetical protein
MVVLEVVEWNRHHTELIGCCIQSHWHYLTIAFCLKKLNIKASSITLLARADNLHGGKSLTGADEKVD